jgi:prephenate dehydrogenase
MIGADPFFVDSWEHDALLAGLVEAPYLLASAMLDTIATSSAWRDLKLLADPTFRYLNQVLRSQPEDLYQECLANRQLLLSWLDRAIESLQQLRRELSAEDSPGELMQETIAHALNARDDWAKRRDERRKEMDIAGMDQVGNARRTFLSLFVPPGLIRAPGKKDETR